MKHRLLIAAHLVLLTPILPVSYAEDTARAPHEAPVPRPILPTLLEWLPGDYTNAAALQLPPINATATDRDRLTTYIRKVDLPTFGTDVLFLEEYRGADELEQERVRLYVFEPGEGDAVRLRLLNPKDPEALRGARDDLPRVQALKRADVTVDRTVCTLSFSNLPNGTIVGRMDSGACDVKTNWVDYELHVGPHGHWVCYSRRSKHNNAITWQLMPPLPCVLMNRVD